MALAIAWALLVYMLVQKPSSQSGHFGSSSEVSVDKACPFPDQEAAWQIWAEWGVAHVAKITDRVYTDSQII